MNKTNKEESLQSVPSDDDGIMQDAANRLKETLLRKEKELAALAKYTAPLKGFAVDEEVPVKSIVEARPMKPISSPAKPDAYDKSLSDETVKAVRNVHNVSRAHGKNVPVIAGPTQRNHSVVPTQPLKSIPGSRTGVFIPNPGKSINDPTKTRHA